MPPDRFAELPFELAATILAGGVLVPEDIERAGAVCKAWREICRQEAVWRQAALGWGLTRTPQDELADALARIVDPGRAVTGSARSWRELAIAVARLERLHCWRLDGSELPARDGGKGCVGYPLSLDLTAGYSLTEYGVERDIWRCKVDTEEGIIASTGIDGGIRVADLATHELIWSIPNELTKEYPHLEGGHGFLVWDLYDGSAGSRLMVYRSERSLSFHDARKGYYRPYRCIRYAKRVRAFRFKYPWLAAFDGYAMVFHNIEEGRELGLHIKFSASPMNVTYIDFDEEFAFVRLNGGIVYARARHSNSCVMTPTGIKKPALFKLTFDVDPTNVKQLGQSYRAELVATTDEEPAGEDEVFIDTPAGCVHMDESDVLLSCSSRVLTVIKGYRKALSPGGQPDWVGRYILHPNGSPPTWVHPDAPDEEGEPATPQLSVHNGRALWIAHVAFLVDFGRAARPEDVRVQMLLRSDDGLVSATDGYVSSAASCSSATLTDTAAYFVVDHEAWGREIRRLDWGAEMGRSQLVPGTMAARYQEGLSNPESRGYV